MTKPIERVYVCEAEANNTSPLITTDKENADRYYSYFNQGAKPRVFAEEQPWVADRAPDSGRQVIALYCRIPGSERTQQIMAFFGSEGHWVAIDHDGKRTLLLAPQVLAWRELPSRPDKIQLGLVQATGWR